MNRVEKIWDAVVVGSGPNGLAAAITMARAGRSVLVLEAESVAGGGMRSAALLRPGVLHDLCSAIHPFAVASPFFRAMPLHEHGLQWINSPIEVAQTMPDGQALGVHRSVSETARQLGRDRAVYEAFFQPLAANWIDLFDELLRPVLHRPRHLGLLARHGPAFGLRALMSAEKFAHTMFQDEAARTLFLGIAAHVNTPLDVPGSAAIGITLAVAAHAQGWPLPRGGSQALTNSLESYLQSIGGEIRVGERIEDRAQIPACRQVFFDLSPRQTAKILRGQLPVRESRKLQDFRYGHAVFKLDWILREPVPWLATEAKLAATVHIASGSREILASERGPAKGIISTSPYVLLAQPSRFDSTRAPQGEHTLWAYCHVPLGSVVSAAEAVEAQIERYAPGFHDVKIARHEFTPHLIEAKNANNVMGDISGGAFSLPQILFGARRGWNAYRLPIRGMYLCSSSTPPGPGVHGMCGFNAAEVALNDFKTAPFNCCR